MPTSSSVNRQTAPKSLFDLCIQLVAENLDLVDSFQGFPSLIGEKIFRCAIKCERCSDYSYENLALELFTDEYKDDVVSGLNLSRHHLGLNFYIDNFLMFKDLAELDVSYCGLGNDHEIMTHISSMKNLKRLVLAYNAISDQGIQKMTTPYRMFKKGPESLMYIDLTGNNVSLKCLKFLACFRDLQSVLLPSVSKNVHSIEDWSVVQSDYKHMKIVTKGWASGLINKWLENSEAKKKTEKQRKKGNFYSRSSLKLVNLEERTAETSEPTSVCLLATKITSGKQLVTDRRYSDKTTETYNHSHFLCRKRYSQHVLSNYNKLNILDSELLNVDKSFRSNKKEVDTHVSNCTDERKITDNKLHDLDAELLQLYKAEADISAARGKESALYSKLLQGLASDQTETTLPHNNHKSSMSEEVKSKPIDACNDSKKRKWIVQYNFIQGSSVGKNKSIVGKHLLKDERPFHFNPNKRCKLSP